MIHLLILTQCKLTLFNLLNCLQVLRYRSKHQAQFFGRGHVAGIDIKVYYFVTMATCVL